MTFTKKTSIMQWYYKCISVFCAVDFCRWCYRNYSKMRQWFVCDDKTELKKKSCFPAGAATSGPGAQANYSQGGIGEDSIR